MQTARKLYREELDHCRQSFDQVDLHKERGYLMKLTTFSANVENIIPSIPRSKHETMFRELLLQRIFSSFDQNFLTAGELVKLRGSNMLFAKDKGPKIYCTYHLGSYRLLTTVLFRQGVDCVQLLGSNMNRSQGEEITQLFDRIRQKHGLTNVFKIVEAGSPSAGLTMLRELKAGRSLVVYVDGSPETAPEPGEEDKFLSVRFGQRRLLTRKGVGYLSHAAKVPIVPVVSYREADMTNVLHCLKPIRPIPHSDREMYCQEAMQQLYDAFWPHLTKYPEQWEGWNYIHSFLEPEKHTPDFFGLPSQRLSFNESRYTLCDLEQAPVLFDRRNYQTYEITEDLRDLLLNMNEVESVEEIVGQEVFGELMEMGVIH
jgi:KDO2-lipid IV(A) lauroyltransferase